MFDLRKPPLLLAAALLFSAFLALPLTQVNFYPSHELLSYPYRLWELHQCIIAGQYYARWFPDFASGCGYPFLNYYAPLVYYIAEFFHLLGFGILPALKLTILFVFLLAALGMWLLAREHFGELAATLAAVLYASAPYFIADIYTRGDLAEALALALAPFCFFGLAKIARTTGRAKWQWTANTGIFIALLILSHNIMAVFLIPIVFVWGLVNLRNKLLNLLLAFILGFGLAAFFWLPAFLERGEVQLGRIVEERYEFIRNFAAPSTFLDIAGERNHPLNMDERDERFFLFLNLAPLAILAAALALKWLRGWANPDQEERRKSAAVLIFSLLLILSLLMNLGVSLPLWKAIPLLQYAQFPWRWLGISSLALAFLAGAGAAALIEQSGRRLVSAYLILLFSLLLAAPSLIAANLSLSEAPLKSALNAIFIIAVGISLASFLRVNQLRRWTTPLLLAIALLQVGITLYLHPPILITEEEKASLQRAHFDLDGFRVYEASSGFVGTTIKAEYLPKAAKPYPLPPGKYGGGVSVEGSGSLSKAIPHRPLGLDVEVKASGEARLVYQVFYFPGWKAMIDGKKARIVPTAEGFISVPLSAGKHQVQFRFTLTRLRLTATIISWCSIILILALVALPYSQRRRQ